MVSTVAQGIDDDTAYNINADTAAAKLAVALGAEKLILLTDVRGLLRDPKDDSTLISQGSRLTRCPACWCQRHHRRRHDPQDRVLRGCRARAACERTHILDGRIPHSILIEMLTDEGIGTMI